jgi:hypothetical protein
VTPELQQAEAHLRVLSKELTQAKLTLHDARAEHDRVNWAFKSQTAKIAELRGTAQPADSVKSCAKPKRGSRNATP